MNDTLLQAVLASKNCYYRNELECEPLPESTKPKYRVYDPHNDIAYEIGAIELKLAKLFNGERSLEKIQQLAAERFQAVISLQKLGQFQTRLLHLGLLNYGDRRGGLQRDPATGITYGPLKRFLLFNLVKMNPQPALDRLYQVASWLCSPILHALLMVSVLTAFTWLFTRWVLFSQDVAATYLHWSWLFWHYPVILSSIAIHELGHALCCRHYRVRVTDFGIGIYTLLATGWVRPEQRTWSALTPGQRAITILMGPAASLYYAAVGIVVWGITAADSPFHSMGVVMVVASCLSLLPTLLPIYNGDTWLALTEYFNQPRLRQRALRYCRQKLTGKTVENEQHRQLYWLVSILTVLGWLVAWCAIILMITRLLP